jgi:hypothetical protein
MRLNNSGIALQRLQETEKVLFKGVCIDVDGDEAVWFWRFWSFQSIRDNDPSRLTFSRNNRSINLLELANIRPRNDSNCQGIMQWA